MDRKYRDNKQFITILYGQSLILTVKKNIISINLNYHNNYCLCSLKAKFSLCGIAIN